MAERRVAESAVVGLEEPEHILAIQPLLVETLAGHSGTDLVKQVGLGHLSGQGRYIHTTSIGANPQKIQTKEPLSKRSEDRLWQAKNITKTGAYL